jgi:hypothetical protein
VNVAVSVLVALVVLATFVVFGTHPTSNESRGARVVLLASLAVVAKWGYWRNRR